MNALLKRVGFPFRIGLAAPEAFKEAEVNARTMPKAQFDQLTNNVKKDGGLSSTPFCWHDEDGTPNILSGHHRIKAARTAGASVVLYLYTDDNLTEEQRTAIQISHNSLVGIDDIDTLRAMWKSIEHVEAKLYSGLDDNYFATYEPVNLATFTDKGLIMKNIMIAFLPDEADRLTEALLKLSKSSRLHWIAAERDYEPFAEALMTLKDATGIYNTASAFTLLIHIAEKYCQFLDERGDEGEDAGEEPDAETWKTFHADAAQAGLVDA